MCMEPEGLQQNRAVLVPMTVLAAAISAIRLGGDAVLDRDWDCYSPAEREEAERHVEATFWSIARELERLVGIRAPALSQAQRDPAAGGV
jgi:hypothetical protein